MLFYVMLCYVMLCYAMLCKFAYMYTCSCMCLYYYVCIPHIVFMHAWVNYKIMYVC